MITPETAQTALVGSRARWIAYLYSVAAALSVVVQLVPHGPGYNYAGLVAVTVVAAAIAAVYFTVRPKGDFASHVAVVLAAILTTATIQFTDGLPNAASLFYLWIVLFVAYFFRPSIAAAYLVLVSALYTGCAIATEADYPLAGHTIATVGAFVGAGVIVGGLKRRIDSLVTTLVETSRTDELTRLPNRRAFEDDMARALARSTRAREPLTLAALDLDHFKQVNDQRGHPAGDEVLRSFARVLESAIREGDLPARIGGEEFAVLFPGAAGDGAFQLAERIRRRVSEEFAGDAPPVTVSIGLATTAPGAELDATELMRRADRALYTAKTEGRNRVVATHESIAA